jgi:hypothetical protein
MEGLEAQKYMGAKASTRFEVLRSKCVVGQMGTFWYLRGCPSNLLPATSE